MTDVNTTEDFADDYDDAITEATAVIDNGSFGTRTIRFETGRLALQAAGSVTAYLDDENMLLSTTAASKHPKEHFDFFPLTVDVEERMYAAGRIPGSFFRREGRPSTDAILTCRLIDRPLRPSFVDGLRNEIQVVVTVLSLNPNDLYDVVAINAASASTQLAGLPFSGPVGGVRVALIPTEENKAGQWVAFPTVEQLEGAVFDMVVAGRIVAGSGDSADVAIMMVEAEATDNVIDLIAGGAQAPTEAIVAEGLEAAKPFIARLCEAQKSLAAAAAKETAEFPLYPAYQSDAYDAVAAAATDRLAAQPDAGAGQTPFDPSLPGRRRRLGRLHPITQTIDELKDIMGRLGFTSAEGPEIEDEWHNFEALNIPRSHPARDSLENFYLATADCGAGQKAALDAPLTAARTS